MLIEQAIKLKLRGSGPPGRTCTSTAGYFYDKTRISEENLRRIRNLVVIGCAIILIQKFSQNLVGKQKIN